MTTYTAALLANTAIPVWLEARRELPFVFAGSAAAAAGGAVAALTPAADAGPARRLTVLGAVAEEAAAALMERRLGALGRPNHEGHALRYGRLARVLTWAGTGLVAGPGAARARGGRGRRDDLAGGAARRCRSSRPVSRRALEPAYTVGPQRHGWRSAMRIAERPRATSDTPVVRVRGGRSSGIGHRRRRGGSRSASAASAWRSRCALVPADAELALGFLVGEGIAGASTTSADLRVPVRGRRRQVATSCAPPGRRPRADGSALRTPRAASAARRASRRCARGAPPDGRVTRRPWPRCRMRCANASRCSTARAACAAALFEAGGDLGRARGRQAPQRGRQAGGPRGDGRVAAAHDPRPDGVGPRVVRDRAEGPAGGLPGGRGRIGTLSLAVAPRARFEHDAGRFLRADGFNVYAGAELVAGT
jgi:hypothetical protein